MVVEAAERIVDSVTGEIVERPDEVVEVNVPAPPVQEALASPAPVVDTLTLAQLGNALAKSGYFGDVRSAAQAVVKVLAGRELGIPPVAAMTGIYIVQGKVTLSAQVIAGLIKSSRKYDYAVRALTAQGCTIEFFERHIDADGVPHLEPLGVSEYTVEDAKRARVFERRDSPWNTYPRNMYFARAMSNGAKWFCPDVFHGPIYVPDEIDRKEERDDPAAGKDDETS